MFGYRFTDNQSILTNQNNGQYIDIGITPTDKKSKRIYLVRSYNKSSILRLVSTLGFDIYKYSNI